MAAQFTGSHDYSRLMRSFLVTYLFDSRWVVSQKGKGFRRQHKIEKSQMVQRIQNPRSPRSYLPVVKKNQEHEVSLLIREWNINVIRSLPNKLLNKHLVGAGA